MLPAIRNNNPGNIEVSADNWQGSTGTDSVYVIFTSPAWGFRALYKDIYNKITLDGLNTLYKIFYKYLSVGQAPDYHTPSEAKEYANFVADYVGVGINDNLTPDETTLKNIAKGVAYQESGTAADKFTDSDYNNGYLLFKGVQLATSPAGIGAGLLIVGGIIYLIYRKK